MYQQCYNCDNMGRALDPDFRKGWRYFTLEEEELQKAKGKRKIETYDEKAEVIFEEGATTYLDEDELVFDAATVTPSPEIDEEDIQILEREEDAKKDKKK